MSGTDPYLHPLHKEMYDAFEPAGWDTTEDRPKLFLDGKRIDLKNSQGPLRGTVAKLSSTNDKTFSPIAARLEVKRLAILEMRGADLSAIKSCQGLTHLMINWATKLSDISVISNFAELEFLEITDAPKIASIAPLAALKKLRWLCFQGGVWNANYADSLDHLSGLSRLEALVLLNLRVGEGGLRPLASLTSLKSLFLSNQFETADYAYLAAHLSQTRCESFAPFIKLGSEVTKHDIMVTGKRKPFLNSRDPKDQKKLEKYVAAFEKLKREFEAVITRDRR